MPKGIPRLPPNAKPTRAPLTPNDWTEFQTRLGALLAFVAARAKLGEHKLLCIVRKKDGHRCGRCSSLQAELDRLIAAQQEGAQQQ